MYKKVITQFMLTAQILIQALSSLSKKTALICLLISSSFIAFTVQAEQISFNKKLIDEQYLFDYQWRDHNNALQSITFSLPQRDIFQRYRGFAVYQAKLAREYVNNELRRHFKKNPVSGVVLSFEEENGYFQVNIKSQKQELIEQVSAKITALEEEFNQSYLTKNHYHQFTTPDQNRAIKPDHGKIASESVIDFKSLKTTILEKSSVRNIRKVTNYVLAFIQSIPYSTLESRVTSSGAGFSPPLKLLWENQGDCDSKVTLIAAILRALMPRIKMALIYIDNHAFIGINADPIDSDVTVVFNGITYVLAEPTGPALMRLGELAPESELAIHRGHYSLEEFHAKSKPIKTEGIENEFNENSEESLPLVDGDAFRANLDPTDTPQGLPQGA